jgi:diguanylate cyclase (GGDEF)-like protein
VLLAGAEEWSSRSLASVIAPHGYAILRSYTDRQTVELARTTHPDAVLMDVGLPESGGIAVCRELRGARGVPPSTPILLVAPRIETRQQRLEALRAGASDVCSQPIDTEELVLRLAQLVAAKHDADAARAAGLTDEDTGLYNARGLEHRLRELHSHARRRHGPLACVVFAVEQPNLRRPAGVTNGPRSSELMAQALRTASRESDVVARTAATEFAVLALDTDTDGAQRLAARLAEVLERLATAHGSAAAPLLRAGLDGVADFGRDDVDPRSLLQHAHAALSAAAPGERTWLRRFGPELH